MTKFLLKFLFVNKFKPPTGKAFSKKTSLKILFSGLLIMTFFSETSLVAIPFDADQEYVGVDDLQSVPHPYRY